MAVAMMMAMQTTTTMSTNSGGGSGNRGCGGNNNNGNFEGGTAVDTLLQQLYFILPVNKLHAHYLAVLGWKARKEAKASAVVLEAGEVLGK